MGDAETADVAPERPTVEVCELGPLGIRHDGAWTSVRGERSSVLLAALSLNRDDGVGSEQLIEAIWPSPDQPPTARQSLANMVSRLRGSFGDDVIESIRTGYRLGPTVSSDRYRFVSEVRTAVDVADSDPAEAVAVVATALGRWRGEPWIGLERPVEVEADRAFLAELHTLGLRTQATALTTMGRGSEAVPILRSVLSVSPSDEQTTELLATALGDLGRRPEALQVIRATRRSLGHSGLVERPELAELEQALLRDDPETREGADVPAAMWAALPARRTTFVGREDDIRTLLVELAKSRIVTVLGPGGAGKSRLATQVASVAARDTRRAVGFVDLVSTRSASEVEVAFGVGLGLPHERLERLGTHERRRLVASGAGPGLLVVDNCEHVVEHVRDLVDRLVAATDELTVLATSRVPLEIAGERRFPIPRFDRAVDLFADRMAAHGVQVDATDPDVAAICELVDHLPLAVELAAAQGPYRTLDEMVVELGRGAAHRDPSVRDSRHRTMAAAIRSSHRLLPTDAQEGFVRLGLFDAPFERSDADAVLDASETDEILDTLVRWSLLERSSDGDRSTYRPLAPIRQYAAAELELTGSRRAVALRYADWLLDLTDLPYGEARNRLAVIDELAPRLANSFTAIEALRDTGRIDDATLLASRLSGPGCHYGRAVEYIEVLEDLWRDTETLEARADALLALVNCADATGQNELFGEALAQLDALDMPRPFPHRIFVHRANVIRVMWKEVLTGAGFDASSDLLSGARDLAVEVGSPIELGWVEFLQSCRHLLEGDWSAAEAAAHRSRSVAEGTQSDLLATCGTSFARLHLGDPDGAVGIAAAHPERDRHTAAGQVIGLVSALATVARGEIELGLAELDVIRRRASSASSAHETESVAVCIAHAAHLLGDDDITLSLLETGIYGRGFHIIHLVPHLCRELGIPLTARYVGDAERIRRANEIVGPAQAMLDELFLRHR